MGLDSVELVMAWEEAFGIPIPNAVAATLLTPRHVIDYFEQQIRHPSPPSQPPSPPEPEPFGPVRFFAALFGRDKGRDTPSGPQPPFRKNLPHATTPNESLTRAQIGDIVRVITLDQLGIDPAEYGEDKLFVDDFGIG